jgi:hypothetical protein
MQEDIHEIKEDIREIKDDLAEHMARSAACEARQDMLEDFAKQAMSNQQENFKLMLASNEKNQAALNKQLKIALGVFAALASLVTAAAAWLA